MRESITYHELEAYQLSYTMSQLVLQSSTGFPLTENQFRQNLLNQTTTITVKIAEGWVKRNNPGLYRKYLMTAQKALEETKLCLWQAFDLNYLAIDEYRNYMQQYDKLANLLSNMFVSCKVLEHPASFKAGAIAVKI